MKKYYFSNTDERMFDRNAVRDVGRGYDEQVIKATKRFLAGISGKSAEKDKETP